MSAVESQIEPAAFYRKLVPVLECQMEPAGFFGMLVPRVVLWRLHIPSEHWYLQ